MPDSHTENLPDALAARLWRKDAALWPVGGAPAAARLGWLDVIDAMRARVAELQQWAAQKMARGEYEQILVLGMGGASLAAAAFAEIFPPRDGYARLRVLDTIHPDAIAAVAQTELRRCLLVVASKSGDTVETRALYDFFYKRAPRNMVVITDENSPLHIRARTDKIDDIWLNRGDIGGRYAALSYFGLAPAALAGVDVGAVLARAAAFADRTKEDSPRNPARDLGLRLGRAARAGVALLRIECDAGLFALGGWVEQLIAESLGKNGKGLVPVVTTVGDGTADAAPAETTLRVELRRAPQPPSAGANLQFVLDEATELGAEFFRWEFATATAAAVMGVNPFDQPDVDATKTYTQAMLKKPAPPSAARYVDAPSAAADFALVGGAPAQNWRDMLRALQAACAAQTYLGILAYLPECAAPGGADIGRALERLRRRIAENYSIVVTLGFAPRYLHSTGQLHKGGPRRRCFLQIFAAPITDVAIPARDYTFGDIYRAQAAADLQALADAGALILRATLRHATAAAVDALTAAAFPPQVAAHAAH